MTDAKKEAAARVKPLVWRFDCGLHDADTIIGTYSIEESEGNDGPFFFSLNGSYSRKGHATVDEAKAAAQADYARRILSALEPFPAPTGVGEAAKILLDQAPESSSTGDRYRHACQLVWDLRKSNTKATEIPK